MEPHDAQSETPTALINLLTIPIIADIILQYLPHSSIFRLSLSSRAYREWIRNTPKVFRYLDLSRSKAAGASQNAIAPIDRGGNSWRAERMDENLTEDEFHAGPLRSVLNKLQRLNILQDVNTLVLDRLASVTHDLLYEIITEERYSVRLLSIRQCHNVNASRLRQLLTYICRPSRPEGTPRLQGLYYFTHPANDYVSAEETFAATGVTTSDGAALGLLPSSGAGKLIDNAHQWYAPAGRILTTGATTRTPWEETIRACSGVIAFDAVLCDTIHNSLAEHLHDASKEFLASSKPGTPTMATIALGSDGCAGCGHVPAGTPVWGEDNLFQFPLLAPAPWSGRLIDAIRPPAALSQKPQRLVVACTWCLVNRHCDSCHKWWCADCYNPRRAPKLSNLESISNGNMEHTPSSDQMAMNGTKADSIKVWNGLCSGCLVGEMMVGAGSSGMWG